MCGLSFMSAFGFIPFGPFPPQAYVHRLFHWPVLVDRFHCPWDVSNPLDGGITSRPRPQDCACLQNTQANKMSGPACTPLKPAKLRMASAKEECSVPHQQSSQGSSWQFNHWPLCWDCQQRCQLAPGVVIIFVIPTPVHYELGCDHHHISH